MGVSSGEFSAPDVPERLSHRWIPCRSALTLRRIFCCPREGKHLERKHCDPDGKELKSIAGMQFDDRALA